MSAQLTTAKRLLTLYGNKLEQTVERFKEEGLESLHAEYGVGSQAVNQDKLRKLEEALGAVESLMAQLEATLTKFLTLLDMSPATDQDEVDKYSIRAEESLAIAVDFMMLLQARIRALKSSDSMIHPQVAAHQSFSEGPARVAQVHGPRPVELPTLPIPKFNGNIWDWDNFWELFNANVHSQELPELFKFNYLLDALQGEAKESVRKFQVTADNYSRAITFLHNRYGSKEELIQKLINRLENFHLRSQSLKDQRTLFEQIQVIIQQLRQKGEQVDSQWMMKKILSKFPERFQRKVLAKKRSTPLSLQPISMQGLFDLMEDVLSAEEMFQGYLQEQRETPSIGTHSQKAVRSRKMLPCMYCKGDHKSAECGKFKTPQQRAQYLRERNLCQLCASAHHATSDCSRQPCFRCQGLHHTSCCFKSASSSNTSSMQFTRGNTEETPQRFDKRSEKKQANTVTKVNLVADEKSNSENDEAAALDGRGTGTVLGIQPSSDETIPQKTFLPIGEVSVVDPQLMNLRRVQVLIDTGAEMSFIESALAKELNLPATEDKQLCYYTFGSKEVRKAQSRKVQLPVWDNEGQLHTLDLLTSDIFAKGFAVPSLSKEDSEVLQSLNMQLPSQRRQVKPGILLGSDQAWQFLRKNCSQVQLPSGLHVLPTTLGDILTGQLKSPQRILHVRPNNESEEIIQWDKYWSLEPQVNMIQENNESSDDENDENKWEKYWQLESAGIHEFGNSEEADNARLDKEVWDNFNRTIERREDGYYVKLPWKDGHPELPDNHAIAVRRLHSVWETLQKDQNLLQRYDAVFQEQIHANILEDVNNIHTSNSRIHYLPHQAVVTPNKLTTKLRIVFDASAHYKGCPSLNEVLHRGPVILPSLFGILLRFRIGRIGLIADVEKAFLQVRLQESERDCTRCLWLWDFRQPPEPANIRNLRFTRVAFGLTASPFLLAATTHYHLDTYSSERDLVREIKSNLYVDNVLLTAESLTEALLKYIKCKRMFNDLSMNLREFVSNDEGLMQVMDDKDRSADLHPKVLGIQWNSRKDYFQVKCSITQATQVSKRTVARAVASIYDPLGWLIPLTHKAKRFLQSLWKEGYGWDSTLSDDHAQQWFRIIEDISGFEKVIPRAVAIKSSNHLIVTFADASFESMAACIYLCEPQSCHLLMARERLPSLRNTMTIPKMELNALTLAMRLTEATTKELRAVIQIDCIYVFSDSEIVLNWMKNQPTEKSIMITNRLKEIHKIVQHVQSLGYDVYFGHVNSIENPADCATRGLRKDEFATHPWWHGPTFLKGRDSNWRKNETIFQIKGEKEGEHHNVLFTTGMKSKECESNTHLVTPKQATTLTQAKRILAYALRFIRATTRHNRCRQYDQMKGPSWWTAPLEPSSMALTGEELKEAGKAIIEHHQRTEITPEIIKKLAHLRVRKDNEGVLRCYGRLGRSSLEVSAKYPILVLQKSFLAKLIINEHHQGAHPGVNHTMSLIRQTFWIPQLRSQVSKQVRACIKCQRLNNLPFKYPEQSDLPAERVLKSRPFEHIGLDYFGPLFISSTAGEQKKCFGCIITCMVTRLIHLDIVSDSSTVSFLHMLRRFFGRRGVPSSITCDNAPTFLLGEEILRDCREAAQVDPAIARELSNKEIKWNHITPYAPWQGGVYERLIKSVKTTLDKTIGKSTPSLEELATVVVEVEAFLNTRPLLYSDSSMDPDSILRPIDFLQNHMQVYFPFEAKEEEEGDLSYTPPTAIPSLRTKQQTIKALQSSVSLTERAWKIWQTQYLTSLRERHQVQVKTKKGGVSTPHEGHLVLIHEETQPRHSWKMGRIEKLCPSVQGIVREAMVRLPSRRLIRRPINLLIPLELEGTTDEDNGCNTNTSIQSSTRYNLRKRDPLPATTITLNLVATVTLIFCLFISVFGHAAETKSIEISSPLPAITSLRKFTQENVFQDFKFNKVSKRNTSAVKYTSSSAFNFRLEPRDQEGGPKYLHRMVIESKPTVQRLENDLMATFNEIHNQVFVTTSIRSDWFHLMCSATLREMGVAERVQHLNHFLLNASLTKERLLRFGTRFVLTDRMYESHAKADEELAKSRKEWLEKEDVQVQIKDVMELIEKHVRRLETTIKEINEYMAAVDRELKSNRRELQAAEILTKSMEAMQDKLRTIPSQPESDVVSQQQHQIHVLNERIAALEVATKPKDAPQGAADRAHSSATQVDEAGDRKMTRRKGSDVTEESDDQYFKRLVQETSEEKDERSAPGPSSKGQGKSSEQPEKKQRSGESQGKRRRTFSEDESAPGPSRPEDKKARLSANIPQGIGKEELQKNIEAMEKAIVKYPFRKIVQISQGIRPMIDCVFCGSKGLHYSDSCPNVVEGTVRAQVAYSCGRCLQCLKFCPTGSCTSTEDCWYCRQVRGTPFEDAIPAYRHHRAICPVPDAKVAMQARIVSQKEELAKLHMEPTSSKGGVSRKRL